MARVRASIADFVLGLVEGDDISLASGRGISNT